MSTPVSVSITPDSPQYRLNQTHDVLPLHVGVIGNIPAPQLVHKVSSSSGMLSELMPGVQNVNRLWSLFENALKNLTDGTSGGQVIEDSDEESNQEEAQNESRDMNRVAYQAQYSGLRVLKSLSYTERGLALIVALREGYVDVIHALLNKTSDLYAADEQGVTALHVAAETGQLKILAYLLKAGCSVEAEPSAKDQRDAIKRAEQCGQVSAAVMMGLYTNIRLSMIEADHPYRHCKGESPLQLRRHRHSTS